MQDPQRGYLHAKSILKDNFVRKNQIARAFIDTLHSDTKIDTNNEIGLVNLARDLEECELIFRELKLHSDINNFEAIGKVIKRLPYPLQNRWVRIAVEIEKTGEEPTKPKSFRRFATHATGVEEKLTKTKRCYLCFRNHYLQNCFEFRRKHSNRGLHSCDKIKCVRWKDVKGNIIIYCTETESLRMHKKINYTLVRLI